MLVLPSIIDLIAQLCRSVLFQSGETAHNRKQDAGTLTRTLERLNSLVAGVYVGNPGFRLSSVTTIVPQIAGRVLVSYKAN